MPAEIVGEDILRVRSVIKAVVIILITAVALIVVAAYGFAPIDPVPFETGPATEPLKRVTITPAPLGPDHVYPEGFAVLDDNRILVAADGGPATIMTVAPDGTATTGGTFATLDGHGIGLITAPASGAVWSATLPIGIDRIDPDGKVTSVTKTAGGIPIGFADDVTIGPDGTIYATDASTRFNPLTTQKGSPNILWDMLEGRPHGRLLAINPTTGETRVVMEGLYFPSGITVAPDGKSLLVAEITSFRLLRLPITEEGVGEPEIVAKDLPGIPDDVFIGPEGHIWLTLPAARNPAVDEKLRRHPFLARLVSLLPPEVLRGSAHGEPFGGTLLRVAADGTLECEISLTSGVPPTNGAAFQDKLLLGRLGDGPLITVDPSVCDM